MVGMADGGREVFGVMKVSLERECVMDRPREEFGVRASGGAVPGLESVFMCCEGRTSCLGRRG